MTATTDAGDAAEKDWPADYPTSTQTALKRRLSYQGAADSLAGAVADAAADAGLNRQMIGYDDRGSGHTIYVHSRDNAVPDVLHDRLTDMGFVPIDGYDAHGGDGPSGCKYEDTKY